MGLNVIQKKILHVLREGSTNQFGGKEKGVKLEEIAERVGYPIEKVNANLMVLEIMRKVRQFPHRFFKIEEEGK